MNTSASIQIGICEERAMVRDFTDEAKEKLLSQISDIESHDWSWFTDCIGDMSLHIQKWVGILSLQDDMSNVEEYHKAILDMNNTKCSDIENIFENVYTEENSVARQLEEVKEKLQLMADNMQKLADGISLGFASTDASSIQKIGKELRADLKNVNANLAEWQEKEEEEALTSLTKENTWKVTKYSLKALVDIAAMPIKLVTALKKGGIVSFGAAFVAEGWDLINNTFAVAEAASVVGMSLIGLGIGAVGGSEARSNAYRNAKYHDQNESLTDIWENEAKNQPNSKVYEFLSKKAKYLDDISDMYDIVDSAFDTFNLEENSGEDWKDKVESSKKILGFDFEEKDGMSWEDYSRIYKKSKREWKKFNIVYKEMEESEQKIKNIKNGFDLLNGKREDGILKSIFDKTEAGEYVSDISDAIEDLNETKESDNADFIREIFLQVARK